MTPKIFWSPFIMTEFFPLANVLGFQLDWISKKLCKPIFGHSVLCTRAAYILWDLTKDWRKVLHDRLRDIEKKSTAFILFPRDVPYTTTSRQEDVVHYMIFSKYENIEYDPLFPLKAPRQSIVVLWTRCVNCHSSNRISVSNVTILEGLIVFD